MANVYQIFLKLTLASGALLVSAQGYAQSTEIHDACGRFERSNIDCACVAKRVERFQSKANSSEGRELIAQGYYFAVGMSNDYRSRMERALANPSSAIELMQAFDSLGGRPENIQDYENGCVIAGAARASFAQPRNTQTMQQYRSACVASSGQRRYCACEGAQLQKVLSTAEFEAYFRSFADYSDKEATTLVQMSQARGKAMGLSAQAYDELVGGARNKTSRHRLERESYCNAIVWADDEAGASAATRKNGGFDPNLVSGPNGVSESVGIAGVEEETASANGAVSGSSAKERLFNICMNDNNDRALCECMGTQMELSMPTETFEFFVDLREGDANGAEDAFAYAAKKRGMSTMEAMGSMGSNVAKVSAAMGANTLSCLGDLPGMP
ncbi:MAG: hypothetical protein AAF098_04680 [Pseudomonadota bacterium]